VANLNRIILVGKLMNDPDVRFTVEGVQVAKFQMEVDRFEKEGMPKQVDNIDIVAWRDLADICGKYLKKGKLVLVEGRIQIRTFENEAGARKWATEVVARTIKMLGTEQKMEASAPATEKVNDEIPGLDELPVEEESELPF